MRYFLEGIKFIIQMIFNIIKWFAIGIITVICIFPYYFIIGIIFIFNKKKRKELGFSKPLIPTIMMILSLTTYFISVFILTRWFVQQERIKNLSESIVSSTVILEKEENKAEEPITPSDNSNSNTSVDYSEYYGFANADFDNLLSRNSDTVAWIKVSNTKINYPVVQTTDNEYYLNHDFNKYSTNVGWIFGDYRDDFNNFGFNTIIYGHNLINREMFGSLPWTMKSSWYKNKKNYDIYLETANAKTTWRVFSIYKIEPVTDYLRTSFYSYDEYNNWLDVMKNRSIYNFGEEVSSDDKVLSLSTCDDTGHYRVVLQAKLVSVVTN